MRLAIAEGMIRDNFFPTGFVYTTFTNSTIDQLADRLVFTETGSLQPLCDDSTWKSYGGRSTDEDNLILDVARAYGDDSMTASTIDESFSNGDWCLM